MPEKQKKRSLYTRMIDKLEKVGDKLPSPFMLFVYLTVIVIVITTILALFGVHVTDPVSGNPVYVKSVLSSEGLGWFCTSFINNVMEFAPFGLVLLISIAVGVAEQVGLFPVLIKRTLMHVPSSLLTLAVVFIGIIFNFASDAAIVIVPALAGLIFYTVGKNPIVGILAGFASSAGAFGANLIFTSYDALLYPLTNEAAATVDPTMQISIVSNWYFFAVSCILLTIVGTVVTIKFIEPKFGNLPCEAIDESSLESQDITPLEKKGLRNVLIAVIVFLVVLALLIVPSNGLLRGENGSIIDSPFMDGIPFFIFIFFLMIGIVYGFTTKAMKSVEDVPKMMAESVVTLKGFIASIIIIAQLIAIFNWSNLGTFIALSCYNLVIDIGLNGIWLLIALVIITMITSIFISSASALWSMFAPMFVPMFMLLGFSPAMIQVAFRIGSPVLTIVSPFMVYIPMVMTYMSKYTKKFNIGMLISAMIPYSVSFFVIWIIQMLVWVFFNLPLGPDSFVYLT